MGETILVLENEDAVRQTVVSTLQRSGFSVATAADAAQATQTLEEIFPCLILLGELPPGASALGFAKRLRDRETTSEIPIVMMAVNHTQPGMMSGLEAEVGDHVAKSVYERELVVRVKAALLRARSTMDENILEIKELRLSPLSHRVTAHGKPIELGHLEYRMLHFLMRNPEKAFTRHQLLDSVWGRNVYAEKRSVDVHVYRLRKALRPHGYDKLIQTVRGRGYRLSERS